jgi:hypothetical protein
MASLPELAHNIAEMYECVSIKRQVTSLTGNIEGFNNCFMRHKDAFLHTECFICCFMFGSYMDYILSGVNWCIYDLIETSCLSKLFIITDKMKSH